MITQSEIILENLLWPAPYHVLLVKLEVARFILTSLLGPGLTLY